MAATKTVPQLPQSHNSLVPRHGVVTLFGYGIQVRVDRGHLLLEDGIGAERCQYRLPRVGHGLKRLVVIGSDGNVSLAALRWLADQKAAFVMLERDGSVVAAIGPVRPSDARLRRAQSLAGQSGAAIRIARELIDRKLAGQEEVARQKLHATQIADTIHRYRSELAEADTTESIRLVESKAAGAFWSAWRSLPISFPRKDELRVPDHWRTFGARVSPLTGSPRLAVNPPNAILNYLYAILESESRLAAAALGLDPGIGVLHVDTPARDSLACDLMEVVRPQVDAFVLDWITREPLKREWFLEQRDGNCRLMADLAIQLSETAPTWSRAVAPIAEWVAEVLWSRSRKPIGSASLPTRLTQRHKREAKGMSSEPSPIPHLQRANLCRGCGKTIRMGRTNCAECAVGAATERLASASRLGRTAARSPAARAKHATSRRRHAQACSDWDASTQPAWLTSEVFLHQIQPLLSNISTTAIRARIGVSRWYASKIRKGYASHPRHWQALAELVGIGM
ncbi:MAG: CRISPR-associated endonuclease Cas1 [Acidobacteria bacterium]|nr:CRISPR-associated endonuclease Cas1 [Acidobacteriota bacterium]